ncbi:hypothetical protein [Amycolatopsis sp. cg13]|uniref:hypothetical protein n=1 Tax=Amycolatopsis sp. cg13 TaxID=3238807 RepID=UPI003524D2C8
MPEDLDFSPFSAPVDPAAALAHAERNGDRPGRDVACCALWLVFLAVVFFGFISVPLSMYLAHAHPDGGFGIRILGLSPLLVGLVLVVPVVRLMRKDGAQERISRYRIMQFAARNGLSYHWAVENPEQAAGIFAVGTRRAAGDVVAFDQPRPMEFGWYQHVTGTREVAAERWHYATTPLDAKLPHLLLNSRAKRTGVLTSGTNDALGHPDLTGPGTTVFSVSGPFGRAREIQAILDRALFSPDLLDRYTARPVHIEIVRNRLYLFARKPFVTTDPDDWRWIVRLLVDTAERLETPPA